MKIVCLGCSLTAGYGVSREDSWVGILSKTTCDTWINAGICGDTTGGMLARLGESVFSHSPDSALLMGGINDILASGSWDCARANMMAMVHQCVARGIRPIVGIHIPLYPQTPHPYGSFLNFTLVAEQAQAYAGWLRLFAGGLRLRTIDFGRAYEAYIGESGWSRAYLPDGLHPSVEGNRVMADTAARQRFLHQNPGNT